MPLRVYYGVSIIGCIFLDIDCFEETQLYETSALIPSGYMLLSVQCLGQTRLLTHKVHPGQKSPSVGYTVGVHCEYFEETGLDQNSALIPPCLSAPVSVWVSDMVYYGLLSINFSPLQQCYFCYWHPSKECPWYWAVETIQTQNQASMHLNHSILACLIKSRNHT